MGNLGDSDPRPAEELLAQLLGFGSIIFHSESWSATKNENYVRWSHLKKLLLNIFDPDIDLNIYCSAYRGEDMQIGRYWIVLSGETIFDEPKHISKQLAAGVPNSAATTITGLLRAYIDTPKDQLMTAEFSGDDFGIVDLLRACDRRIGKRRLAEMMNHNPSKAMEKVIVTRFPELARARR